MARKKEKKKKKSKYVETRREETKAWNDAF